VSHSDTRHLGPVLIARPVQGGHCDIQDPLC
jgi:hypothetical protein